MSNMKTYTMKMTLDESISKPVCWTTNIQAADMKIAGPSPLMTKHTGNTNREASLLQPYLSSSIYISPIEATLYGYNKSI